MLQIPTVAFLYIAGYIGYVGREYIKAAKKEQKPTVKEYIIDVPFALKLAGQVGHGSRAVVLPCVRALIALISGLPCMYGHCQHCYVPDGQPPHKMLYASAWLPQSHRLPVSPKLCCWSSTQLLKITLRSSV